MKSSFNYVEKKTQNNFENVPENLKIVCRKYTSLTKGKGKFLDYQCELRVDETVKPVQQRMRRQPYQLRESIKRKLQEMENEGIIEKVETPETWISNMVTPKKNGDVRICLDARQLTKLY